MVAGIPHVYRVEQNYYFRIKTPKLLKDKYKAPQIKKSLYTSNLQIANYRAAIFRRLVLLLFKVKKASRLIFELKSKQRTSVLGNFGKNASDGALFLLKFLLMLNPLFQAI